MKQITLTENNFNKLKLEITKNKEKEIVFTSEDDGLNRKVIEKLPIQILLIPLENKKDYSKQRDSGFNQVMAKIAKKNNIKVGISLDEIITSKKKERILARLKQNIVLCHKNKVQMVFIEGKNKRNIQNLKSLMLILGMHTSYLKNL